MKNWNYLVHYILISDIQDYIKYMLKKHANPSTRIYINEKNRITLKIKKVYYVKYATLETIKLLGSSKSKITKVENSENVPHLGTTEVILYIAKLLAIVINRIKGSYINFFLILRLTNY